MKGCLVRDFRRLRGRERDSALLEHYNCVGVEPETSARLPPKTHFKRKQCVHFKQVWTAPIFARAESERGYADRCLHMPESSVCMADRRNFVSDGVIILAFNVQP